MRHNAKPQCRCLTCGSQAATFGSRAEWSFFWNILRPLLESGKIRDLEIHPSFELPGKPKPTRAVADFAYTEGDTGRRRVIDVKGPRAPLTASFRRNVKQVKALYGVTIEVVEHKA